ncbi:MAG: DALR domain-containing protein [Bacteroidota bacterium]
MSDDFNTPMALARLFELVTRVNGLSAGHLSMNDINADTLEKMKHTFRSFIYDIFGLLDEASSSANGNGVTSELMELIIDLRQTARANKDWSTSDKIRDTLKDLNILLKDGKDGTTWSRN